MDDFLVTNYFRGSKGTVQQPRLEIRVAALMRGVMAPRCLHSPQSDGMVEHYVKKAEEHMTKVVSSHQRDWGEMLPLVLLADVASTHETTGMACNHLVKALTR